MSSVMEPMGREAGATAFDRFSSEHAHALALVMDTATDVKRRYQFFIWAQSYLGMLVPHHLTVCGAYQRHRKEIGFEAFNSVPMASPTLSAITDGGSALMQQIIGSWIDRRGRALLVDLTELTGYAAGMDRDRLIEAGFADLLVHGVSRPQRPSEIESLFIFASQNRRCPAEAIVSLEMLVPHVHSVWLRVQATERELSGLPATASATVPRVDTSRSLITERENQILFWVREGKSNQEIGDQLGISVLTVKNHVQKILRKLGAANRAQAVAKAMTLNLLVRSGPDTSTAE